MNYQKISIYEASKYVLLPLQKSDNTEITNTERA